MNEEKSPPPDESLTADEFSDRRSDHRDRVSEDRDRVSENADRVAEHRDRTSEARDRTAEDRDRSAEQRDRTAGEVEAGEIPKTAADRRAPRAGRRRSDMRVAADRAGAASDREDAASDRAGAASDREAASAGRQRGADDRGEASDDREVASADRDLSARDRETSSLDELTGAYRRGAGLVELERELTRAKRAKEAFVLAFIDVDGLKARNDSLGHAAGDELLRGVVDAVRARLRSYDLVIRFGGDEFICGLSKLGLVEGTNRFELIKSDFVASHGSSITVGLAELEQEDSLAVLIARADDALYEARNVRSSGRR